MGHAHYLIQAAIKIKVLETIATIFLDPVSRWKRHGTWCRMHGRFGQAKKKKEKKNNMSQPNSGGTHCVGTKCYVHGIQQESLSQTHVAGELRLAALHSPVPLASLHSVRWVSVPTVAWLPGKLKIARGKAQ